jgi:cellulose synthase/poly-beta-1,6-N-acetylglucosamine synthase-like glycosyltransferase
VTDWTIGVVVPANDEAEHIGPCLTALHRSLKAIEHPGRRHHTVVVADACRDRTVRVARTALAGWGEVVEVEVRSAGAARGIGVERLLEHLATSPRDRLWLASTDADTVVPVDWLIRQLELADAGAVATAGVVAVDTFDGHPAHVRDRFLTGYDGPPDEAHPHVHGANLGVRGDAYLAVGGWLPLAVGEDRELWRALRDRGFATASSRSLTVTTSGRAAGRARGGFADFLSALHVPESA